MFIKDLQDGRYVVLIDDMSLYAQFQDICRARDLRWVSGRAIHDIEIRDTHRGLVLYVNDPLLFNTQPNFIFSWGYYDLFCRNSNDGMLRGMDMVRLSELEDFSTGVDICDQTACADYFLSQYI